MLKALLDRPALLVLVWLALVALVEILGRMLGFPSPIGTLALISAVLIISAWMRNSGIPASSLDRPLLLILIWFALGAWVEFPLARLDLPLPRPIRSVAIISAELLISAGLLGSIYARRRKVVMPPSLRFKTCATYFLIRMMLALGLVRVGSHAHLTAFFFGLLGAAAFFAAIWTAGYWIMGWTGQLTLRWGKNGMDSRGNEYPA